MTCQLSKLQPVLTRKIAVYVDFAAACYDSYLRLLLGHMT